eukprot:CAMPEP_0201988148 /NCGR_PEP_ID=MMETSP0904-20121228/92173_1 /ASSEMBLY_ACC=CAM_ASM_000553 /TAXON_ID=420261 /ORGANISM="Thalassiosira antarctica, Strain CCMP982" /LENGTH=137 /DNA_ID=CAMNT_0048542297 /DNA_START=1111 /DNA_END=1523 /DNA_ORIENTATION=-
MAFSTLKTLVTISTPFGGAGDIVLLCRALWTDAIQGTFSQTAPDVPPKFVHELQVGLVCDDESIEGTEIFGDLGVLFFSREYPDVYAHGSADGTLEFLGPGCLLNGLIQSLAPAPKHRQRLPRPLPALSLNITLPVC